MAGKITPELQSAQNATAAAAEAMRAQLTPEQFSAMTDGTVSVYDVFVAQKLVKSFNADGTPNADDPAAELWDAVEDQIDAQGRTASFLEFAKDDLNKLASDVNRLFESAGTGISSQWDKLFGK